MVELSKLKSAWPASIARKRGNRGETKPRNIRPGNVSEKPSPWTVTGMDRYGRHIAFVILPDGKNLNHELVKAGMGWWYQRYAHDDHMLEALEAEARENSRGLWSDRGANTTVGMA